jgi:hypothetical protein
MGTSPLTDRMLKTPPLGSPDCWSAGKGLVLQGPQAFLGALWVLTASQAGQPARSAAPPLPPPPGVAEGAIPFIEVGGIMQDLQPPPETPEGATAFIEDTAT